MAVKIDESLCAGCGICVEACSEGAITIDQVAKIDPDICTDCYMCVPECPNNAIVRPESENTSLPVFASSQEVTPVLAGRTETNPEPTRTAVGHSPPAPFNRGSLVGQVMDFFRLSLGQDQGRSDGRGRGGGMRTGRGRGRRG